MAACPLCRVAIVAGMNEPQLTDEMVDRGANALCDRQGSYDSQPTEEQYRQAEAVLRSAFRSKRGGS